MIISCSITQEDTEIMSSIIIGILLLLSLIGLIYYAVKGKNLMVGFLIMIDPT